MRRASFRGCLRQWRSQRGGDLVFEILKNLIKDIDAESIYEMNIGVNPVGGGEDGQLTD